MEKITGYEKRWIKEKGRYGYFPVVEDLGVVIDTYMKYPKISGAKSMIQEDKPGLTYPEWHGAAPEQPESAYVRRKKEAKKKGKIYEPYNRKGH